MVTQIKGRIFSGTKKGKYFVSLDSIKKQIIEKMKFIPFPGTLNIELLDNKPIKNLKIENGTIIKSPIDNCFGIFFKAKIMDQIEGAIAIIKISNYPSNVIEIIAPVNLRKKLDLKDGDIIEVIINNH